MWLLLSIMLFSSLFMCCIVGSIFFYVFSVVSGVGRVRKKVMVGVFILWILVMLKLFGFMMLVIEKIGLCLGWFLIRWWNMFMWLKIRLVFFVVIIMFLLCSCLLVCVVMNSDMILLKFWVVCLFMLLVVGVLILGRFSFGWVMLLLVCILVLVFVGLFLFSIGLCCVLVVVLVFLMWWFWIFFFGWLNRKIVVINSRLVVRMLMWSIVMLDI